MTERKRLKDLTTITIKHVFPMVDKTVIHKELLDWGIDSREIPLLIDNRLPATMSASSGGVLLFNPNSGLAMIGGEAIYIGLVHELAHFLQYVEGRFDPSHFRDIATTLNIHEWAARPEEIDANHWMAKQAKAMGWSKEKYEKFIRIGYPSISEEMLRTAPLQRRPVLVHGHRRRR